MIKAQRLTASQCKKLLFPEAYDIFILSDWAIWEVHDCTTVDYMLVVRTGVRTRKIHSVRVTREKLSQTILDLARGVDE